MLDFSVAFDRPAYLLLLGIIPLLWLAGRDSLRALGPGRRLASLGLRSAVVAAIVLALADVQWQRKNEDLTVVFLLDQSLSVPDASREEMVRYVTATLDERDRPAPDDRYAVIAFARDAAVELPPISTALALPARLETEVDPEATDLAGAVRQAQALFPAHAAKRLVLVTDGNENAGQIFRQAQAAAEAGIGIDVVPVYLAPRGEAAVEKVDVPPGVRKGQPFDMRIVLRNDAPEQGDGAQGGTSNAAKPIPGRLVVIRKAGETEQVVADQPVTVEPGKQVFTIGQEIEEPDFYAYEARFVPDDPADDGMPQNNAASAFTHIRGRGQALVIENFDQRGQFEFLIERLRAEEIDVTAVGTDELFGSLAELQRYDAVVLANVSRSSTDDADNVASFSDEQIEMLVRNTRELGCGLVMIGGPDAYGAGGWANTKLEEAMPVDFQIKAAKVVPVGALSLVVDRSGSMDGEKLQMAKAAAVEAIRAMGPRDYVSVVAFDGAPATIVANRRVGDANTLTSRVSTVGSGGGTDVYLGMASGFAELRKAQSAAVKHMIVLTDGQTPESQFARLVADMRRANISVTAVAVGDDANVPLLQDIARRGGGKFYMVRNPKALPRIFLREVRRVARPLVYEPPSPVAPQRVAEHEILEGVESLPPIRGLVLTSVKENPLVEVLVRSPLPATEKNSSLLATWTYGAGKAAALTTDAGARWAADWTRWDGYDKFFSQLIRWAMRPSGGTNDFAVATNVRGGVAEVVVTALEAEDAAAASLPITGTAVGPKLAELPITFEQVAPGRYIGTFPAKDAGSYLVAISPGRGALLRTGVNVGYSEEYRDRETNLPLLESLAALKPRGGPEGKLYRQGLDAAAVSEPDANDPFRHDLPPAVSSQFIWPWVVVAGACVFWADVFVRRVQVDLAWIGPALAATFRRRRTAESSASVETMRRLQSRKAEVASQLARTRFEPSPTDDAQAAAAIASPTTPAAPSARDRAKTPPLDSNDDEATSFTQQLLRAKRDVRK